MGLLIDGVWQDTWYDTKESGGRFVRSDAQYRDAVTADGSSGFKAEADRYHLFVSYACPWAHRTLIYRSIKGLTEMIDVSVVHWYMAEKGWTFQTEDDGIVKDKLFGSEYMYEVYLAANEHYSGRVTVPVLWDKQSNTIVSNESSEIIRMFNTEFDALGATPGNYYPDAKRDEIDSLNERIYETLNNGVYRSGFATTQTAYEEAVSPLFDTLDFLEARLANSRFLVGDNPTEADWRLLPTLLRFDLVYHGHFKCNIRKLCEYEHLWGYTRDLYQWPGVASTFNATHAKNHYYASHETINPTRVIPTGPDINFMEPHQRNES
ncbi:MAG: glutathione S-transferase family protein [Gammaproteobacteria bacterium]|nr:glutathione S-transferase family protein [Gammaproteobacteria bacterium]